MIYAKLVLHLTGNYSLKEKRETHPHANFYAHYTEFTLNERYLTTKWYLSL